MRSPRSKNSRAKERALQIERAFLQDLIWLAFLVATAIFFLPLATQAGDFQQHEMKLRKIEVEIQKHEEDLRTLAKEKAHAVDPNEKERIHNEMLAAHKQLEGRIESYNDEKAHIRFKHPEKGDQTERHYSRHVVQPLSSYEDVSFDGQLDSFLAKFHRVYGQPPKAEEKKPEVKSNREVASEKKKEVDPDSMDQSLTLSK